MTIDEATTKAILDATDRVAALELLQQAISIPSVTGQEAEFGRFMHDVLVDAGLDEVVVDEFAPNRVNVIGRLHGDDTGNRLLILGHLDTVHARGWAAYWGEDARRDPFGATIVDGQLWGRGAGDVKGGICAAVSALRALRLLGLAPHGGVDVVLVSDEESGETGSGVSAGVKKVLPELRDRGYRATDLAIYVEPTKLDVYTAQMGFVIADITVHGKAAYFGTPWLGVDAVRAGHRVLSALWAYSDELARTPPHHLLGGPFVLVTGVSSGEQFIAVPGEFTISLIRKLLPGDDLEAATRELGNVVSAAIDDPRIRISWTFPAGRDHQRGGRPTQTSDDAIQVELLCRSIQQVNSARGQIAGAPYWSENSFIADELDLPAVYFAPGNIENCHTFEERVSVADYQAAVAAYALFMAEFCGLRRVPPAT